MASNRISLTNVQRMRRKEQLQKVTLWTASGALYAGLCCQMLPWLMPLSAQPLLGHTQAILKCNLQEIWRKVMP